MAKETNKTIPWNEVKAKYLKGATPKALGLEYGITAREVTYKAKRNKWTSQKATISHNIEKSVTNDLEEISSLCTNGLKELLKKDDLKPSERIQAIRLGFDITLLNKNKADEENANLNKNLEALTKAIDESKKEYGDIQ